MSHRTQPQEPEDRGAVPRHELPAPAGSAPPFAIHRLEATARASRAGYPHRHGFYQVLYVTAGRGAHLVDFTPLPVAPPCLYCLSPGQVHFWQLEEPLAGTVVLFAPEFAALAGAGDGVLSDLAFFHSLGGSPLLPLAGPDGDVFAGLVGHLEDEYRHPRFGRTSALRAWLHLLLVEIQRRYLGVQAPAGPGEAAAIVRRFKRLVSERFAVDRAVAGYARTLGLTPGHLGDTVKALTGRTAGQLIREEVTLEAKRLLAHGDRTVAEIAYHLNFDDPAYFGRFFRREAGVSPGVFRREFREKYQENRDPPL
ncbi:MAG: helix-turn-helix domain-containing protein [Deferrisomatales bacterium]